MIAIFSDVNFLWNNRLCFHLQAGSSSDRDDIRDYSNLAVQFKLQINVGVSYEISIELCVHYNVLC
jgi:hypothetical protein